MYEGVNESYSVSHQNKVLKEVGIGAHTHTQILHTYTQIHTHTHTHTTTHSHAQMRTAYLSYLQQKYLIKPAAAPSLSEQVLLFWVNEPSRWMGSYWSRRCFRAGLPSTLGGAHKTTQQPSASISPKHANDNTGHIRHMCLESTLSTYYD